MTHQQALRQAHKLGIQNISTLHPRRKSYVLFRNLRDPLSVLLTQSVINAAIQIANGAMIARII
ncbi:MAG: hypothetical protein COB41_04560 [Proteobacteria bacterium]|nr:MAG: hypothetical protein COB41_04560 [Pseudomonadota bacterium]